MEEHKELWDGTERRGVQGVEILNLHDRMNTQDAIIREIRDKLVAHIAAYDSTAPSLEEMASLWKASKYVGSILATVAGTIAAIWSFAVWAKDHIKF